MSRNLVLAAVLLAGVLAFSQLNATVPHTFAPNTPISSTQVNENFTHVAPIVEAVELREHKDYGTETNNKVPRFEYVEKDTSGAVIQYVDDAVTGVRFVALQRCKVDVGYFATFNTPIAIGWTVDAQDTTTNLTSLPSAQRKSYSSTNASGHSETTNYTGILEVGQVLQPRSGGGSNASLGARHGLWVVATRLP